MGGSTKQSTEQQAQDLKQQLQSAKITDNSGNELKVSDVRYDEQEGRIVVETS